MPAFWWPQLCHTLTDFQSRSMLDTEWNLPESQVFSHNYSVRLHVMQHTLSCCRNSTSICLSVHQTCVYCGKIKDSSIKMSTDRHWHTGFYWYQNGWPWTALWPVIIMLRHFFRKKCYVTSRVVVYSSVWFANNVTYGWILHVLFINNHNNNNNRLTAFVPGQPG